MKVQLVDPSAFTPPYDRALAAALARAGAEVELLTSRFLYGAVPPPRATGSTSASTAAAPPAGSTRPPASPSRRPSTCPTCCACRRARPTPTSSTTSGSPCRALDVHLLPPLRPRVLTAHYILPPRPSRRQVAAARRVFGAHGRGRRPLRARRRPPPRGGRPRPRPRSTSSPTAPSTTSPDLPEEKPLPPELEGAEGPVILFFGLLRPYKGIENLLEAFRRVEGAELWIVGNPRMDVGAAARARRRGPGPRPLRHPLRRRRRDPGDLPPRRPPRPPLPRRRALRRPLHRPRLRQADGARAPSAASPRSAADRRRPPGPARRHRRARRRARGAGGRRGRPRRARRRRPRAPPPAPSPGTRPPASPSTSTAS